MPPNFVGTVLLPRAPFSAAALATGYLAAGEQVCPPSSEGVSWARPVLTRTAEIISISMWRKLSVLSKVTTEYFLQLSVSVFTFRLSTSGISCPIYSLLQQTLKLLSSKWHPEGLEDLRILPLDPRQVAALKSGIFFEPCNTGMVSNHTLLTPDHRMRWWQVSKHLGTMLVKYPLHSLCILEVLVVCCLCLGDKAFNTWGSRWRSKDLTQLMKISFQLVTELVMFTPFVSVTLIDTLGAEEGHSFSAE